MKHVAVFETYNKAIKIDSLPHAIYGKRYANTKMMASQKYG